MRFLLLVFVIAVAYAQIPRDDIINADQMVHAKLVTVALNGIPRENFTFTLLHHQDFTRFLYTAGMNLATNARRAFTPNGAEITDVTLIDSGDFIYISEGEPFRRPDPDYVLPPAFPDENFGVQVLNTPKGKVVHISGLKKLPIGIPISITTLTGWGNFAYHLAYEMLKSPKYTPILLDDGRADVFLNDLDPTLRRQLKIRVDQWYQIKAVIEQHGLDPYVKFDFPLVLALASELKGITEYKGSSNIGFVFFEDSHFSDWALREAYTYDMIVAGSTWNAEIMADDWNMTHIGLVLQGVDLNLYSPAPKQNLYPDRFVIFSGGKLEFRKAQDVVVAAYKRFQARHPDALLMVAWQNFWHKTIDGIDQTGYCEGKPSWTPDGVLLIEEWLTQQNGLPVGSVKSLGPIPNSRFSEQLHEADVAIFPNRCEGGTNLVAMEALAAGIPTIISANTGHLDLVDESRCYPLYLQYKTPRGHWKGMKGWGDPDVNEIVENLEHIYLNRQEAKERAMRAAEFMQQLAWENQVPIFLATIDKTVEPSYGNYRV